MTQVTLTYHDGKEKIHKLQLPHEYVIEKMTYNLTDMKLLKYFNQISTGGKLNVWYGLFF
jgi:hypothetical protein